MNFKCPHCHCTNEYSDQDIRRIFMRCKNCGRDFRPAESSPLTSNINESRTMAALQRVAQAAGFNKEELKKKKNVARLNSEAATHIKQGDYDRAIRDLKQSLKQNPNQPKVEKLLHKISSEQNLY